MAPVIYHPQFAMGFPGMRFLHPFDSYRASRAYDDLKSRLPNLHIEAPARPCSDDNLCLIHSQQYLDRVKRSSVRAWALEVPVFAMVPKALLDYIVVTPMRWAVEGTLVAARQALQSGLAFSLSGGFHHAKPEHGEGFCLFNDIGYAIRMLKNEGKVKDVLYVDLDAHQGNGVCYVFADDRSVKIFDLYNGDIYPRDDVQAQERIDVNLPLKMGANDEEYLGTLEAELPKFLDEHKDASLLVYNAGTDPVMGDLLGGLQVSPEGIKQRDLFVIQQARKRNLPVVVLPSGGYTRGSYKLISDTIVSSADLV